MVRRGPGRLTGRLRWRTNCQNEIRIQGLSKLPRKEFNFGHLFLPWLLFLQLLLRPPASKTVLQISIAERAMPKTSFILDGQKIALSR